jgi:hypothetical protein
MIPSGARVFLRSGAVDFRKGPDGLVSLVREAGADPHICVGRRYVAACSRSRRFRGDLELRRHIISHSSYRLGIFLSAGWESGSC